MLSTLVIARSTDDLLKSLFRWATAWWMVWRKTGVDFDDVTSIWICQGEGSKAGTPRPKRQVASVHWLSGVGWCHKVSD